MSGGWDSLIWLGAILAIILYFVLPILRQGQRAAKLELPNGRSYAYLVGDYMRSYGRQGSVFHGIDVSLPKEMPHIYLDSLRGGGRRMQYVIDPSQHIRLEGNFNKDYRVYVPKKYEALTLSILSPDVMALLQDHATAFDIEIYGSHVRVISNKRVLPNARLQAAAIEVATKVMAEVDHRLQSWSKADSLNAVHTELLMYPVSGFRVFGWTVRLSSVLWALYWLVVTLGLGVVGIFMVEYTEFRTAGAVLIGFFLLLFVGALWATKYNDKKTRFGSRH